MRKLRTSFVLAIYNAERTLKECMNSILMQNIPKEDYEIIIVDGGSNDSTLKIVKEFMKKNKNIRFYNNPHRYSEGPGMGKAIGISKSRSEIVILLDHDNILLNENWTRNMLLPFKDKEICATQSMLCSEIADTILLKYINEIGVEDPFAIPNSIVSQVSLYPEKFQLIDDKYYVHVLDKNNVLFGGANGCAYRKKTLDRIGGYTRDVDDFARMADLGMKVAIVKDTKLYHKTSSNLLEFFIKKGKYFYRFINEQYKTKKYNWIDKSFKGKMEFYIRVMFNLSLIGPTIQAISFYKNKKGYFWIIHPLFLFFMTLEYILISLFKIKNFVKYSKNS